MGKFSGPLEEAIYVASLDGGPDEEIGDAQDFGWYGLMRFKKDDEQYFRDLAREEHIDLTEEDYEIIRSHAGAIIYQNQSGFVFVSYYKDKDDLEDAWNEVVSEADKFYGETEE